MSTLFNIEAKKSSIVITGGASGIGFSLAKQFLKLGHEVIIASRRAEQLLKAQSEVPELKTIQADVSSDEGRIAFHKAVIARIPQVNVLVNNAGILAMTPPFQDSTDADWQASRGVFATNTEGPMHLSMLFLPHLLTKEKSAILNVGSFVAFIPVAVAPAYCASKAAIHSFTVSLRYQLKSTNVAVIEILPPMVRTDINDNNAAFMDVTEYTDDVIRQLAEGRNVEIYHASQENIVRGSRAELDAVTEAFNSGPVAGTEHK